MLNPQVKYAPRARSYAGHMSSETMGDRIKRLRVARGLSQEQLGELVGVGKSAVSQWEGDSTKNLKLKTLARVLAVLNTDLQYLVWGEDRGPDGKTPPKLARRRAPGT
jgi:transcriptional regulator with XRE-family HTH domain